jgi:hypothetical protein
VFELDDGVRDRIDSEGLTDGAPLSSEFLLLETVGEHHDCGLLFSRREQSPHDRLGVNDLKKLWRGLTTRSCSGSPIPVTTDCPNV